MNPPIKVEPIDVLIPTYNRPLVLQKSLDSIFSTFISSKYTLRIYVGIQDQETLPILEGRYKTSRFVSDIGFTTFGRNIGKAPCLNELFDIYCKNTSANYVLVMDNDMVFQEPWAHIISASLGLFVGGFEWDFLGYGSSKYFIHIPDSIDKCDTMPFAFDGRLYVLAPIIKTGGGMLFFHKDFLAQNPWESYGGGAYLGEDDIMNTKTNHRAVLYYNTPWVVHDPYGNDLYPDYARRKAQRTASGWANGNDPETNFPPQWVFPSDWDQQDYETTTGTNIEEN